MRQIETKMCKALLAGKPFRKDNTKVRVTTNDDGSFHSAIVTLFGNEIAHYYHKNEDGWVIRLTDAEWDTVTTRSRLNALMCEVVRGDRTFIYREKGKTTYRMGANRYEWQGTHLFLAHAPEGSE